MNNKVSVVSTCCNDIEECTQCLPVNIKTHLWAAKKLFINLYVMVVQCNDNETSRYFLLFCKSNMQIRLNWR